MAAVEMGHSLDGLWWWRLVGIDGRPFGYMNKYADRAPCHRMARGVADQLRVKLEFVYPLGK